MSEIQNSFIYSGRLMHYRHQPKINTFSYSLNMLYIDLDEIEALFSPTRLWKYNGFSVAQCLRKDYFGNNDISIKEAVKNKVLEQTGSTPSGPIRMLTHCRFFGILFNPVSFYFCFDQSGKNVEFIMAEITNIPWLERHCYALDCREQKDRTQFSFEFDKAFHISPFMDMEQHYNWSFGIPGDRLTVEMSNYKSETLMFEAFMNLERKPATASSLDKLVVMYPYMTAKIIAGIYWEAFKLKLKKIPFHTHPKKRLNHEPKEYVVS